MFVRSTPHESHARLGVFAQVKIYQALPWNGWNAAIYGVECLTDGAHHLSQGEAPAVSLIALRPGTCGPLNDRPRQVSSITW